MKKASYDALIIGGGPGGCSCALWLTHLGLKPILVEKTDRLGGSQNYSPYPNIWILGKNYKDGKTFAREVSRQIQELKIPIQFKTEIFEINFNKAEDVFEVTLKKKRSQLFIKVPYIVIATGVVPKKGGFEPSSRVLIGPGDHIETTSFKNKTVAILGGGDNAFENYQFIKKQRPRSVQIFARHVRAQLPFVKAIKKGDLKVGDYVVDIKAQKVDGKEFDFIVVMYGWEGFNALEPNISLRMNQGFIETDNYRRTSNDSIYAVGEVTQASHPCCVTAMADGIIAAKDIQQRIDSVRVPREVSTKV